MHNKDFISDKHDSFLSHALNDKVIQLFTNKHSSLFVHHLAFLSPPPMTKQKLFGRNALAYSFNLSFRYSLLKYVPMLEFANLLNFTAMSFGNHDFDDGIEGLAPFVQGGEFQLSFKPPSIMPEL